MYFVQLTDLTISRSSIDVQLPTAIGLHPGLESAVLQNVMEQLFAKIDRQRKLLFQVLVLHPAFS